MTMLTLTTKAVGLILNSLHGRLPKEKRDAPYGDLDNRPLTDFCEVRESVGRHFMRHNVTESDGGKARPLLMVLMLVTNACVMGFDSPAVCFATDLPGRSTMSKVWAKAPLDTQEERTDSGPLSARAINAFGLKMYSLLAGGNFNLIFSPSSIFTPLATVYEGARGRAREEMAEVLEINQIGAPLLKTLGSLHNELNRFVQKQGAELYLANALWAHKSQDWKINRAFREKISVNLGITIREANFESDTGKVAKAINDWVAKTTQGNITHLVSAERLSLEQWEMAILNAVYFKSRWAEPFSERRTRVQDFTLLTGSRAFVPMMRGYSNAYSTPRRDDLPGFGNAL